MIRAFNWFDAWTLILSLRWTLYLTAMAFAGGIIGGLIVALLRTSPWGPVRVVLAGYIRIFQGVPLLILLLLAFFGPSAFLGTEVSPWFGAALAFTLYASAAIGEILRSAITSVPTGQTEAARLLGMSRLDVVGRIVLPQALRRALPSLVGFLIQLLKSTSLASVIGFIEITKTAQLLNTRIFHPFTIFTFVGAAYFCLCWPLSRFGRWIESRTQNV